MRIQYTTNNNISRKDLSIKRTPVSKIITKNENSKVLQITIIFLQMLQVKYYRALGHLKAKIYNTVYANGKSISHIRGLNPSLFLRRQS